MVTFRQKNIISVRSLGEELCKARRGFNLSLLAVERRLGIAKKYLEALENNNWELLPGDIYARNFLRKYVEFLGLNWNNFFKKYKEEVERRKVWVSSDKYRFCLTKLRLLSLPKILKKCAIGLVILGTVGYLGVEFLTFINPPKLELLYPEDNYVSSSNFIKILGKVEKASVLRLNDKEIAVGEDGFFKVDLDLNKGLNVIKFEAEKSTGKKTIEYERVIVE